MSRPLLAVDTGSTLYIANYDTDTSYTLRDAAFPAPARLSAVEAAQRWGMSIAADWDNLAERTLDVDCIGTGADAAAMEANAEEVLNALSVALSTAGAKLLWSSAQGNPTISTTIRVARVSEESVGKLRRAAGLIRVSVSVVTDSDWADTSSIAIAETIAAPGMLDASGNSVSVTVAKGDRPARMRLRVVSDASGNDVRGFGIKRDPTSDYDPRDAYATAATNLTSAWADLVDASGNPGPDLDTNANRGAHIPMVKATTNAAAAASTRYRADVMTNGSGVSRSSSAQYTSVAAATNSTAAWQVLPQVVIPAGGVPGITTGSGYAAAAEMMTQKTGASTVAVAVDAEEQQTVTLVAGRITSLMFKCSGTGVANAAIYDASGNVIGFSDALSVGASATEKAFPLLSPPVVAAGVYTIGLRNNIGTLTQYYSATNPYAGGQRVGQAGHDLYCAVTGQLPLGFDSKVNVEGKCSESSKTATLHEVVRLPADDFAVVLNEVFGANEGFLIENADPLLAPAIYYAAAAENTAGDALSPVTYVGQPRLVVGENRFVYGGSGAVTITGSYWPCYSNAAAGAL